jgi:hypothetical protein
MHYRRQREEQKKRRACRDGSIRRQTMRSGLGMCVARRFEEPLPRRRRYAYAAGLFLYVLFLLLSLLQQPRKCSASCRRGRYHRRSCRASCRLRCRYCAENDSARSNCYGERRHRPHADRPAADCGLLREQCWASCDGRRDAPTVEERQIGYEN